MPPTIVRPSKFRRVYGTPYKKSECYENLKISPNAWDSNMCKVNPLFFSVNWNAGGGAFAVIPLSQKGKTSKAFVFTDHNAPVLDTEFSPFNDHIIASGSDDAKVRIWNIPSNTINLEDQDTDYIVERKVGLLKFHNQVENFLLTTSSDGKINFWDISKSLLLNSIVEHKEIVNSMDFNYYGNTLVTTSKDKKIRLFDIRNNKLINEAKSHEGLKAVRCSWMGKNDTIITSGFSKLSERQLYVWDTRKFDSPVVKKSVDNSPGIIMLFYDPDTNMIYAAGKVCIRFINDGNIRFYEYTEGNLYYLDEYMSNESQRGAGFMPKRGLNVNENEVARIYKVIGNTTIEPAEAFQADIYPETLLPEPTLTFEEYFSFKEPKLKYFSMESGYVQKDKQPLKATKQILTTQNNELQKDEKDLKNHCEFLKREIDNLNQIIESKNVKIRQLELEVEQMKLKN